MGNRVFVDTGWFKGIVDKKDDYHIRAIAVYKKLKKGRQELVTTNFIVAEAFTLVRKTCGMYWARRLEELFQNLNDTLDVERVTTGDEEEAWKWFWYDWRELTYTDCTSFAVMERMGIKLVATFDEHFALAGFESVKP